MLIRFDGEGLCHRRGRHDRRALHREDEGGRGQDQDAQPASPHGVLWGTWCVLSTRPGVLAILIVNSLGDTVQFAEFVERNIRLYQIRNTYSLRPSAAASWVRRSLAESLRSRHPYSVNLLLGGYDTASHDPHLYWIDYLGTISEVPFAAHGYGSYFALSLLDR